MVSLDQYSGKQKAAMLLLFLGPDLAAPVYKSLDEEQIEMITLEIAKLQNVEKDVIDAVVEEFYELMRANEYIAQGGVRAAQELLERALGIDKAQETITRLTQSFRVKPFDIARSAAPAQLFNLIQNEHPQTIALIMGYLQAEQGAEIIKQLNQDTQVEVIKRLALMDRTTPDTIKEIESILEKKLSLVIDEGVANVGGVDPVVAILNLVDRSTEKQIIETLEMDNPELSDDIKRKMFVFEDVVLIDDRGIQRIIREIDMKDLALALKSSGDEVKNKFVRNMSKRAGQMLIDDMEFLGPVRLRDVEDAQQKIVNVIRKLEDAGEVIVSRGGSDDALI